VTTDLDWINEPVRAEDLRLVGASVLRVALAIERVVGEIKQGSSAPSSRATIDLASPVDRPTSDGSTHLAHAQGVITTASLAGADHMRGFVIGVRSTRTTVSNWTLARGALEAFGRAKYLLDSEDANDLFGRSIAFARKELHFAKDLGHVHTRGAGPLDVHQHLKDLTDVVKDAGITEPKAPSATALTTDLIEASAPGSGGRLRYSQLSAAAHGESAGVQMFMNQETGALVLSRPLVIEAAHMQAAAAISLGDQLLEYFSPIDARAAERWRSARDAALLTTWQHAGVRLDDNGKPRFPGDAPQQR
jgi:hypothetical protein